MSSQVRIAAATTIDLDPSFYAANISADEIDFFRRVVAQSTARSSSSTNITTVDDPESPLANDEDETIKQHIFSVQGKAFAVHKYDCIRRFAFIRPKIATLPGYKRALELLACTRTTQPPPVLLDVGCCFGNDIRKAVLDGWPAHNVVACDLRREFWDIGHELFKSTPETFPATFLQGDIFDNAFLSVMLDSESPDRSTSNTNTTPLNALTTLTPLIQRVSAFHTSSFFHLFTEAQQLLLARRLATLLLPSPGSIIFGQHAARPVAGFRVEGPPIHPDMDPALPESRMFCHSLESWKRMWEDDVFGSREVHVDAELIEAERKFKSTMGNIKAKYWVMSWSVQLL